MDIIDETGTFYVGNKEYSFNGCDPGVYMIDKVYNTEGYANNFGVYNGPHYQYYRRDHLGNNREVWRANNNQTIQKTQYYPSGLPWADATGIGVQNKKYNGKEFVEMHGLDSYDYGARGMYPAIGGRFMSIDPLCEKYYSISPYAWCGNNPVSRIDPTGMDWVITTSKDKDGNLIYHITVNGALYNNSSTNYTDKQINQLKSEMKSQVESTFNVSGDGYSVQMNFNINTVSSVDQIKSTDHVFQIVDQSTIGEDVNGNSELNGLNIKIGTSTVSDILNGDNKRTLAHELGHSGGLFDANLPKYKQESEDLRVDLSTNLMTQSRAIQRLGGDPVSANSLTIGQINKVNQNYMNGNLNQNSPVGFKMVYNGLH